jgi:hypothetical protein
MKMHLRQAPETDAVTRILRARRPAVTGMVIQPRMLRNRSGDTAERRQLKQEKNAALCRVAATKLRDHTESQFQTDTSTFHLNAA